MSLLEWTGNPFVDGGIAAILAHHHKRKPEDITQDDLRIISEWLPTIYISERWKFYIRYTFTVNHPLLQNSHKTDERRVVKFKEFLLRLLSDPKQANDGGNCIACGSRNVRSRKKRIDVPLTGSGSARSFFSGATDGADYCDICAFAIQCSPLFYYACGGRRVALLHSSSDKLMRAWASEAHRYIQKQISLNNLTGCFNEGYKNPQNALFYIAQHLISLSLDNYIDEQPSLCLYHFMNGNRPNEIDLQIYSLPAPVFRFLLEVKNHPKHKGWQHIVQRGFRVGQKQSKDDGQEQPSDESYKNSKNQVYLDMLAGRSILHRFINTKLHKAYGDFSLLAVYLTEVLFMDKTRIETVKKVVDEIAAFIRQSPKGERRLRNLEESVKFRDFCNVLRRISKERLVFNPEEPLFTLDEFAEQLFPEGALTFGETRYLILFRLYEQLHDWLLEQGITSEEADDGIVEVGDDKPPNPDDDTQLVEGAIQ